MAMAMLIGSYILQELRVNEWFPDGERIYRVFRYYPAGSGGGQANTPSVLGQELADHFPVIEQATYLSEASDQLFSSGEKSMYLDEVAIVDSNFLNVFQLPLLSGNSRDALLYPRSIIISESVAKRFFGRTEVVGRTIKYNDDHELSVTGVFADLEGSTHLDAEVFIRLPDGITSWLAYRFETYIKTTPGTPVEALESSITDHLKPLLLQEFTRANFEITENDLPDWRLQPLSDIHLFSQGMGSIRASRGDVNYLYIFGFIGLLVLLMAAINYINLTTARAANRAREIGVRKVTGALKGQLIGQFLTESVTQSLLATVLALPLAHLALPLFNEVSGRNLSLSFSQLEILWLPLVGLSVLVGLLAGMYPALMLSGFQPVKVLKADQKVRIGGTALRKFLVVGQFTGVIILIVLTAVMYRQVNYMLNQDLGFGAEQVVVIPMNGNRSWRRAAAQQQNWKKQAGIIAVSTASSYPGDSPIDYTVEIEGQAERYRSPEMVFADAAYQEVLGLEVVSGRFFSDSIANDTLGAFLVNEAFVREYELKEPVGKRLRFPWRESWGEIIGVVKDYHYEGLDNLIQPMAFFGGPMERDRMAVRFHMDQWTAVLAFLREAWPSIEPAYPFRYDLLDKHFATQYAEYERIGSTFLYSAGLTILVAILGLVGLATFTAQKRAKEIGIRKVLGASVAELTGLLIRQFTRLALVAGLFAIPIAYLLARRWLTDFAYQTPLGIWPFLLGIMLAVGVALLTVSVQSWRVANDNPVRSLKSE